MGTGKKSLIPAPQAELAWKSRKLIIKWLSVNTWQVCSGSFGSTVCLNRHCTSLLNPKLLKVMCELIQDLNFDIVIW